MAPPESQLGIPGYRVTRRIGAGVTGTVYAAEDTAAGGMVVVKVLHPHLVRQASVREAFLQAVARVVSLDHPGVVPVLMSGESEAGDLYVITAQARGCPLTDLLSDQGALGEEESLPLLLDLASALGAAHAAGLVHGDLTPENIWVRIEGTRRHLAVTDFGMNPLHMAAGSDDILPPYYLSPEQIRGQVPSVRSDVYALGIIAFQLLTGRLPFSSPKPRDVLMMHLNDDPPPPGEFATVTPETEVFLFQALSKDPMLRFRDMAAVANALSGGGPEPRPARSRKAEVSLRLKTGPADDDLVVVRGDDDGIPPAMPPHLRRRRRSEEWDHAEASGQFQSAVPTELGLMPGQAEDAESVIVEQGAPTRSLVSPPAPPVEAAASSPRPPAAASVDPARTGMLPRPERSTARTRPRRREEHEPLRWGAALLGLLSAAGFGVASFKALTGVWPF